MPCPRCGALAAQPDFQIAGVVTQPDRPRGRGQEVSVSPVKSGRDRGGHPGIPAGANQTSRPLRSISTPSLPDVVVIIAYGQIIPARLIAIPRLGWINLHGSLLPKYRGAAPIHWAIANGETRTGLTTMQIDAGLDTGPMLLKYETEIGPDETSPELSCAAGGSGRAADGRDAARARGAANLKPTPQDDSQATFAPAAEERRRPHRLVAHAQTKSTIACAASSPGPGRSPHFAERRASVWGKPVPTSESRAPGASGTIQLQNGEILVSCGRRHVAAIGSGADGRAQESNRARVCQRRAPGPRRTIWRLAKQEKSRSRHCGAWRRKALTRATCCIRSSARASSRRMPRSLPRSPWACSVGADCSIFCSSAR